MVSKQRTAPPFEAEPGEHWYDPDQHEQPEPKPNGNGQHREPVRLRDYTPRPFSDVPMRQWQHAGHYIRRHVVMTVGPGGYGKTSLNLANAIEMATCRGLLGPEPSMRLRVLYWNGEDPDEEIERRIAAVCIHYEIDPKELQGWLFLGGKLLSGQRFGELDRTGNLKINFPMLAEVETYVRDHEIDVAIFDPLLAFHRVPESKNEAMEELVQTFFGGIAERRNCCIELSHHTRKSQSAMSGELGVDDSRGGGSVTNAARSVRVLNRMTKKEAEQANIEEDDRRHYLRVNRDKTNLAPAGSATWIRLVSVPLPNGGNGAPGDNVQCVEQWNYPKPFDNVTAADMHFVRDRCRTDAHQRKPQSKNWVGKLLAERFGLDVKNKGHRDRITKIVETWIKTGALRVEMREDQYRNKREFVVPGNFEDDAALVLD